jgi:hypothetical protein
VVVADFSGDAAVRFELVTLLFLAAWMNHTGASRAWPLHLVCIGGPPRTVTALAERAGAAVVRRPPLVINPLRTSNKLRGFEVEPRADRLVLLDADILVLKDLAGLLHAAGHGIGLSSQTVNHYPESTWRRIFDVAGVRYPGATGACLCRDPRIAAARGLDDRLMALCRQAPPYFSSAVVVAPWSAGLAERWRGHLERVIPLFTGPAPPESVGDAGVGDEHGLATAVESLRREGVPVAELPLIFHGRPVMLRARTHVWAELAVFHYMTLLKPYAGSPAGLGAFLYGRRFRAIREPLARAFGLRAIHSPVYRLVPREDGAAAEDFYRTVHRLYQTRLRHVNG